MRKFIIQFNESNFDIIKKYSNKYDLPNFKKLLNSNTFASTKSENKYEYLEPWIQWYSFYTEMPYEDHNVFHLGDCLKNDHENFVQKYAYLVFKLLFMHFCEVFLIFLKKKTS